MQGAERQSFVTENRKNDGRRERLGMPKKAPKPRKPTHQDRLEAAIGKKIELCVMPSAGAVLARLVEVDQFTITVERVYGTDGNESPVTYFKSALCWFQIQD